MINNGQRDPIDTAILVLVFAMGHMMLNITLYKAHAAFLMWLVGI